MSDVLREVEQVLRERLATPDAGSYSATLLADPVKAQRKLMEEAFELCLEVAGDPIDPDRLADEAADVVFHLLAAVVGAGCSWDDVEAKLAARRGTRRTTT